VCGRGNSFGVQSDKKSARTQRECGRCVVNEWFFFFLLFEVRTSLKRTYVLTPWSKVLLEKLTGSQLVNKFPVFYGTRRFIAAFTSARHLSLSRARPIHSMPPHRTSWRSILIFSFKFQSRSKARVYGAWLCQFLLRGVVSTSPNTQAGGPPLLDCPRLLIQDIRRPFLHPQPEDAPCRSERPTSWKRNIPYVYNEDAGFDYRQRKFFSSLKHAACSVASFYIEVLFCNNRRSGENMGTGKQYKPQWYPAGNSREQSLVKLPAFFATRSFITIFTTRARHLCLSWARPVQATPILCTIHFNIIFPSTCRWPKRCLSFPSRNLFAPLLTPVPATWPLSFSLIWLL
jgi:hypothetical protein